MNGGNGRHGWNKKWEMGLNIAVFERTAASGFVGHSIFVCPPL